MAITKKTDQPNKKPITLKVKKVAEDTQPIAVEAVPISNTPTPVTPANKKPLPVTFISGKYSYYQKSTFQEHLLLKALRITSDPNKIKQMIGVKKVADVARIYDKLSSRKEYSSALNKLGMSFEWIAKGLKLEAETAEKSADRIKALQIVLKSTGMDTYEDIPESSGSWEDLLLKSGELNEVNSEEEDNKDYHVNVPVIPESAQKIREKENEQGKRLYEK